MTDNLALVLTDDWSTMMFSDDIFEYCCVCLHFSVTYKLPGINYTYLEDETTIYIWSPFGHAMHYS